MQEINGDKKRRIIWKDKLLSPDYIPEQMLGREKQKRRLKICLAPLRNDKPPLNVWLYGPAGTGKTALAKLVLKGFSRNSQKMVILYINCWERRSLYSVLQKIAESLKILGGEAQDTTVKLDRIRHALTEKLTVVILDDIDRMTPNERERAIYTFLETIGLRLICISKRKETFLSLEMRVRSRLNPVSIPFLGYSTKELEHILRQRASEALALDSSQKSVLAYIAQIASGDARIAVHLLRQAALKVESEGKRRIETGMIQSIDAEADNLEGESGNGLSQHEKIIYELIKANQPIYSKTLLRMYHSHCNRTGILSVARRTFSKHVKTLIDRGVITTDQRGVPGRGRLLITSET